MKNKWKRLLSTMLAVVMMCSLVMPTMAIGELSEGNEAAIVDEVSEVYSSDVADDVTESTSATDQVVIMSTTDIHGKVWEENILNDTSEKNNLLRVSTAVSQYRQNYGDDNVLVYDAGDLYQGGGNIASYQISLKTQGLTAEGQEYEDYDINPMALSLAEIGYTASILGNHEFNYAWDTMEDIYAYLENEGVDVVCANLYYKETGERVFNPYHLSTITLADGTEYTVGVIGLENTDCTRWDVEDNYPGMVFGDPSTGNDVALDLATEVKKVQAEWAEDGIAPDFVIVCYHGALESESSANADLVYATNTENQVRRIITNTTGVDMVISGHDHSTSYSNSYVKNAGGEDVLVVNGGGTQLTATVLNVTVNDDGTVNTEVESSESVIDKDETEDSSIEEAAVTTEITSSENLVLSNYAVDTALQEQVEPYVDLAKNYINTAVGSLLGWDGAKNSNSSYYLKQTDTVDLINRAQIAKGSEYVNETYTSVDALNAKLKAIYGEDTVKQFTEDDLVNGQLTVDFSSTSVVTSTTPGAGDSELSIKDIYGFYKYDNSLYLIVLTGQEIKDLIEYNASDRITVRFKNGEAVISDTGDYNANFTFPVFYGLNYTINMAEEVGNRVVIGDFSNGKEFSLDGTYIFAINNYHLGNTYNTVMGQYTTSDAIWSQTDDLGGGYVQDLIAEYMSELTDQYGGVYHSTAADQNGEGLCTWSIVYDGEIPADPVTFDNNAYVAEQTDTLSDGDQVFIYYNAEDTVVGSAATEGNVNKLSAVDTTTAGGYISTSEEAALFTVEMADADAGTFALKTDAGYLTSAEAGNGLSITAEKDESGCSLWKLEAVEGGFHVMNVGANYQGTYNQALEYYSGGFTTYGVQDTSSYLFTFYKPVETATKAESVENGKQYVIYLDVQELCINGDLGAAAATVAGGRMILPLAENTLVVTANINDAGQIDFTTADGKHLTSGPSGGSLSLTDELAADDCSLWTLNAVDDGFQVMNVGANYAGNNQALEYYGGKFTTYGVQDTPIYTFNFYEMPSQDIPAPEPAEKDIVVLYTNDVHCGVDNTEDSFGYAGLAALKKDMEAENDFVTLVDAGDAIQGAAIGTLSKGAYIVDIMNYLGYDYATVGNHEFDYNMDTLSSLVQAADFPYLACNFNYIGKEDNANAVDLDGYAIADYDGVKVAYVGIATPESLVKSTPTYFQDADGNWIYDFCNDADGAALYAAVQSAVDAARADGADYVVALAHLGIDEASAPWRSTDVIANTTGIDVVLDGHSHSVIAQDVVNNKNGEAVLLSSTGTKLANVGKLTIKADGTLSTELIARADYDKVDAEAAAYIADIESQYEALLNTVVAHVDYDLVINNPDTGIRAVRYQETNLGDVCADAYRYILGADIAFVNGGGVRAAIAAGDVTYDQIISVHPFGNMACMVEATGQQILDALEMSSRAVTMDEDGNISGELGGFLQVSGLKYTINTAIASTVETDTAGMFVGIAGERRVSDVQVLQADGTYAPIDPEGTYKLASHNYMLKQGGDGINLFMKDTLLADEVKIDNQVLIEYMTSDAFAAHDYSNWSGEGRITIVNKQDDTDICDNYSDIDKNTWYHEYVHAMLEQGLMNGTGNGLFQPNKDMTRAELVTLLYRYAGTPDVSDVTLPFTDVPAGTYYTDAVAWAYSTGVIKGTSTTTFAPDVTLTREMMVTIFYRMAGANALSKDYLADFTDADAVSGFAKEAMNWAVYMGLINGVGGNTLAPQTATSRAMVCKVLQLYI